MGKYCLRPQNLKGILMSTHETAITTSGLSKRFSEEVLAVDDVSLCIPTNTIYALLGPNGAGKTTLFSSLLDLIKPTKGRVINNGVDVSQSEGWKSFTTAFLDETFLIGYLMPEEYFYFIGELRGLNKKEVDAFLVQFEDLFHGEILGGKKFYEKNISNYFIVGACIIAYGRM